MSGTEKQQVTNHTVWQDSDRKAIPAIDFEPCVYSATITQPPCFPWRMRIMERRHVPPRLGSSWQDIAKMSLKRDAAWHGCEQHLWLSNRTWFQNWGTLITRTGHALHGNTVTKPRTLIPNTDILGWVAERWCKKPWSTTQADQVILDESFSQGCNRLKHFASAHSQGLVCQMPVQPCSEQHHKPLPTIKMPTAHPLLIFIDFGLALSVCRTINEPGTSPTLASGWFPASQQSPAYPLPSRGVRVPWVARLVLFDARYFPC